MLRRGKKAKTPLSEEEQLLLYQQKLLAEEEMAKKKERLLSQFLKDKLAKEEQNSALNLNKINTQWRTVLREVKTKELHKDIEILSQTFERVVDCKDSVIKSLAKDLSEAEEQYAHALRSHLHNIDQLLALQRRRLHLLEESYNNELEVLTKEFETERKTIIDQHEKEIHYLQDVFMAMEQNYIDSEYESKLEFQSMWDDLKNKNLEEKHFLRIQLENVVEDLWRRFQEALKNYTDATEDRKIAFETLKVKDEKSSKEIEAQMKKIQKLQGEKILKLAEICRKYETEEEKVLPFYSSVLTANIQEENEEQNPEELTMELVKVMADYVGMENFWKRYNKVKLEQLSLQHRRAQLLEINGKLREMLKQYLDGISVSDEVLSKFNPLFIVNHQSNLSQPLSTSTAQSGDKPPPTTYNIIEAAHIISHTL
ncbi:dynein regulatory complex subunit 2 isoform X2 [Ictidomys tridecemlineatus]|uniref:dynein regulatory complex subunit 2 isoform X2 n=1 Tax=Ictidomys tridecemlineatus TaxID=43179 RepID=UPI000B541B9B|nr:dynein regulatory complex subunit 2 isoform X2 [Ictidomys tridecemlineatus]KAG3292059.1 coiled-coil domain containing 65, transcript variant X2 [Ictidomys tridecemlineatus]